VSTTIPSSTPRSSTLPSTTIPPPTLPPTTLPPPTVALTWATQNASGVDLSVDGPGFYGSYGAAGSQILNVVCDGHTHTFRLTAKGTQGQTATKTISVATHKESAGDTRAG
jgi:hypothetical protein